MRFKLSCVSGVPVGRPLYDSSVPACRLSSDDLDLLALWFTLVKILHAVGALAFIPPLIAEIGACWKLLKGCNSCTFRMT